MNLLRRLAAFAIVFGATRASAQQAPQTPQAPRVTVLRAARMLDVKTGTVVQNATVVVTGTRITAAGADVAVPAGARIIDLGDVTLLPGLIDAHTHLLQNYEGRFGGDDPNM